MSFYKYSLPCNLPPISAICSALSLIGFGHWSQSNLNLAFSCLGIASIFIAYGLVQEEDWVTSCGLKGGKHLYTFLITANLIGFSLGLIYRFRHNEPIIITTIHPFAITAIMVGAVEELVFRGALLSYFKGRRLIIAILFGALAHTLYKISIFWSFPNVDTSYLFRYTFMIGLIQSWMRIRSSSVWPCICLHAWFDFLVYGDRLEAPWWVW